MKYYSKCPIQTNFSYLFNNIFLKYKKILKNWLNLRKVLHSFINQLRYFANNAFQKGQEVEVAEIVPNQEQERADPKIPGDPPSLPRKTKKNEIGAM